MVLKETETAEQSIPYRVTDETCLIQDSQRSTAKDIPGFKHIWKGMMRLQAREQQGWQFRELCLCNPLESVRASRSGTAYPKVALHNLCETTWGCSEAVTRWRQGLTVSLSLSVSDAEGTWKVICLLIFRLCSFIAGKFVLLLLGLLTNRFRSGFSNHTRFMLN